MKLHRDLGVTQKTAWHMQRRIREAFAAEGPTLRFEGPVEVDETYFGGREKNKHEKDKLKSGRGTVGKTAVVGTKDRDASKVVESTDRDTLQGFVADHAAEGANVFTDEARAYEGTGQPLGSTSQRRRVRSQPRPHQRRRIFLVDAQAGTQGHFPQALFQASATVCGRIRRSPQHS